jgi:RHS repeat-associated protein
LGVSSYTTNASNELTANSNATYTYDNNGNTLTSTTGSNATNYTWDYENRLTSVTLPGSGGTVTFKYDPAGRRIQKVFHQGSTTTTTNYVYDGKGPNLIEEVDNNGSAVARYAYGKRIDEPLAELRSGVTSYYETDGMGSVSSLSNSSGASAQTYTYDSFGNLTASAGSLTNPFRYTGREFDYESSLYFYRARYYDPRAGRFISEDPLRFGAGDVNFYDYVGGNPINYRDPSGQTSIPIIFWGMWCGPNWTGGRFEQYDPKHAKLYREPWDAADAVCEQHDICYYRCRDSVPCDADGRSKCMRVCDARLILNMPSTGVGPILAAGIDFFNDHPDAGTNAPNCPGCKAPSPPKPSCVGFSCLDNR